MISSVLVLTVLSAADPPELDELQGLLDVPVVSGASRTVERADDAPATVTVATGEELRRFGLRSLDEAINFLSLGLVAQNPLLAVEVGSRGLLLSGDYGNHVLLVIDGHVMNEQWNATAYFEQGLGLPLEVIDHVEFIVGPGSVLYGSSAMLGVINVVTRRAADVGHLQLTAEGSAIPAQDVDGAPQLRWPGLGGTARLSLLTSHATTLAGLPFELTFAAEYFARSGQALTFPVQSGLTESDGVRTWPQSWGASAPAPGSWGGSLPAGRWWTQVPSGLLTVQWGELSLWVRAASYGRASPAHDPQFVVAADFAAENHEVDRWVNLELRWARTVSSRVQVLARGYLDLYDYTGVQTSSSWLTFGSGEPLAQGDPADFTFTITDRGASRSGGLEAQATWDWLGDGRFQLMAGVDGRLRHFDHRTDYSTVGGAPFSSADPYAADEFQVGIYAQQRARLLRWLHLNVGARLDLQSEFAARLSPRAAVVVNLPWDARLKAVVNSAFRAPSGYERFAAYGGVQLPTSTLRPESVLTGELGYEQRLGRHRVYLAGFVSNFTDLVRYVPVGSDSTLYWFSNQGSILNLGAQGQVEGRVGPLHWAAALTAAVNRTTPQLVASPGWFGNARLWWRFGEGRPTLSLLGTFSGSRLITAAYDTGVDAAGQPVSWTDAQRTLGPQGELRAVLLVPVPRVKGLWVRATVGGSLAPFSPYSVGARQAPDPSSGSTTPTQAPNERLFGMLSAGWSLDGP